MKKCFFTVLLCCFCGLVCGAELPLGKFADGQTLITRTAVLPGTDRLDVVRKGFSLSFSCRITGKGDVALIRRAGQFALEIRNGKLQTVLYDTARREHRLSAPEKLPFNRWFQVAYVLEYYSDFAQGEYKYIQKLYMNGKPAASAEYKLELAPAGKKPFEAAMKTGQLGEVRMWDHPLDQAELDRVVKNSKLTALKKQAQQKIRMETFMKADPRYQAWRNGSLLAAFAVRPDKGHPLLAVFDTKTGKEITGKNGFAWDLTGKLGGKTLTLTSEQCSWSIVFEQQSGCVITWKSQRPALTIRSRVALGPEGLTAGIEVENLDKDFILEEVSFPRCRLSRKDGNDTLLFPFQSGAEVRNPTVKRFRFGQKGVYPALFATMQFDAYYAENRGVYLGMEDPCGVTKKHDVTGRNEQGLDIVWGHFVPYAAGITGGNTWRPDFTVRLRVFDGGWFEAGGIYRKFLERGASWWIKELPRRDTPERYRNGTITFTTLPTTDARQRLMNRQLLYLREYLDIPIECVHTNQWYVPMQKGLCWPHSFLYPLPRTLEMLEQFKGKGIVSQVYIDSLLWAMKDGPGGKSDHQFARFGEKYAVKNADGTIPYYKYSLGKFAIECPGAAGWIQYLNKICDELIKIGFLSIYHDQVGTCQPRQCFDPNHGHLLNDPSVWTVKGYRPMMKRMKAKYPHISHSTEDFSEVYADIYDSAYNWRWTCPDLVPVMQSIYCGRVQFVGKETDRDSHGDPESFYAKAAFNLVYGEWVANLAPWELGRADFKRIYIKRLVHLRKALIDYFNAGRMLPPLKYKTPMPLLNAKWGGFYAPAPVQTPVIQSNSFRLGGNTVFIFINTTGKTQKAVPILKGDQPFYRCSWDLPQAVPCTAEQELNLKPYQIELRVCGSRQEADRLQNELKKLASFQDRGRNFDELFMEVKPLKNTLKKGELCTPAFAAGVYHCDRFADGVAIGSFEPGAKISYGEIDFGPERVSEIQLVFGVSPYYQGCSFEFGIQDGNKEIPLGTTPAQKSTGGVRKFITVPLKLSRTLTGKQQIYIRYYGRSWGSNIAGWKY